MTKVLHVRNVNQAFPEALWHLRIEGINETTRNGPCIVAPGPVVTEYRQPRERILWDPKRDANPVFHLMESIWMMAGQNNVAWLLPFNAKFEAYAESDQRQWGAYGYRWRKWFRLDQIRHAIEHLQKNPGSRRCVIGMWDPRQDLTAEKAGIPCNTHIYLDLRGGRLNFTVCCRSNDMLWGAYGANVVHFSILQELMACELGVSVGLYRQMSNNFHVYTDLPMAQEYLADAPNEYIDEYRDGMHPVPLLRQGESIWDFCHDAERLVQIPIPTGVRWMTKFFEETAWPLYSMYLARKRREQISTSNLDPTNDWHLAFMQWLDRRIKT